MNIVFLTNSFYPNFSANSKCIYNIANVMSKKHNIKVVCYNYKGESSLNNYNIISFNYKKLYIYDKYNNYKDRKSSVFKLYYCIYFFYLKLYYFLKQLYKINNIDLTLKHSYTTSLDMIDTNIDVLIPTCNPVEAVLASIDFKQKRKNVLVCPYLFDKFATNNSYYRFNKKIKLSNNLSLEYKFLLNSDIIFSYSSWINYINENYPYFKDKLHYIEHPLYIINKDISLKYESKDITIIYAGILNDKVRNPTYSLSVLYKVIRNNPSITLKLYNKGNCDRIISRYENLFKKKINYSFLPYDQIRDIIDKANYLLVIGNNDISQLQSKVYELFSTGKPIIYFCKSIEDPIHNLFKLYNNSCIIYENDTVENNEIKIMHFILNNTQKKDIKKISKGMVKCTPNYVSKQIVNTIKGVLNE